MKKPLFITTPIYYVNDVPHIGHAYTTIAADILARFYRLKGHDVFFLTGTDEHGQKIEQAAAQQGETPIALADRVVERYRALWKALDISHQDFIRTTESHHREFVQNFFTKVKGRGEVYLGEYEDWYCTPCETFLTQSQLVDGRCPECHREVKKLKESSYFFRLSHYTEKLLAHYDQHPSFIGPDNRLAEVRNFVAQGLRDLSISRTTFRWGIPVPGDDQHVIYVWFDALLNYLSALHKPGQENDRQKFWPAFLHLVGKDILRFHAVFWPAFLMAAGESLPGKVFAHGWWTVDGKKMSKSLGNVVDPQEMIATYGADAFRYFLFREVPFGQDGNFSIAAFETRINADLANDIGNLLSRSVTMHKKYLGDVTARASDEKTSCEANLERDILQQAEKIQSHVDRWLERVELQTILQETWALLNLANLYIDRCQPWTLAKDMANNRGRLTFMLNQLLEILRMVTVLTYPFMPGKMNTLWQTLGFTVDLAKQDLQEHLRLGQFPEGQTLQNPPHLFPRLVKTVKK